MYVPLGGHEIGFPELFGTFLADVPERSGHSLFYVPEHSGHSVFKYRVPGHTCD